MDRTFYVTESRRLAAIAAEMGVPPSEVEDVVAEVWLEAVKYRQRFANAEVQQPLSRWLIQVLHSKAVNKLRHLNRHPHKSLDMVVEELIDDAEAKRGEVAELAELLDALLEQFRSSNETALQWTREHFLRERPIRELAQEYGTTVKSVDCRIRRLLSKCRQLLEPMLCNRDMVA